MNRPPIKAAKPAPPEFPYISGFCGVGNHAGTTKLSEKGSKQIACEHVYYITRQRKRVECMCSCHDTEREFQALLAATGKSIPTPALPASVLPAPSLQRPLHVAPTPASVPSPASPFGRRPPIQTLPGGRVVRGELTKLIYEVLTDPVVGIGRPGAGDGTPKWIQMEITLRTGMAYQPSVGAIHSCLEKWSTTLLVTVAEKPYRVTAVSDKLHVE